MNLQNGWNSVKEFFQKLGKRNLVIAGAVTLIIAAVAVNWIVFSGDDGKDGFDYDASAGMSTNYGTTLNTGAVGEDSSKPTGGEPSDSDSYFSSVEVSRQRARDEALEVLNAVVENDQASEEVKAEAMKETERNLRVYFALQEIARKEHIVATEQELLEAMASMAQQAKEKNLKNFIRKMYRENRVQGIRLSVITSKVIDLLARNAKVTVAE